jgi:DNA repair protein RadC
VTRKTLYKLVDRDITLTHSEIPSGRYTIKVRDLPQEQKPKEKMAALGPKSLSLAELIAILLGTGTRKEEVMSMSERILKEYGEKVISSELSAKKLSELVEIPIGKASQIIAALEIGRRFYSEKYGKPAFIKTPEQAYQHLKVIAYGKKEQLRALYLNSRYQIIHDEIISVGSLTSNIVHPREVFQPAIEHGAIAIIIAHNHPSGNLEPTQADIDTTKQLIEAGRILGVELIDHLIISSKGYGSILIKLN